MKWPKKIRHISSNKEYIFYQDCLPSNFAWYIGETDVYLTKISAEDLDNGYYLGWDDDYDWENTSIPKKKEENTKEIKIEPCKWGHNWKKYVGFSEVYEYCIDCDKKREKNE